MIELGLLALAGLAVGALANLPVERLPDAILAAEQRSAPSPSSTGADAPGIARADGSDGKALAAGRRWRTCRRIILSLATAGLFFLAGSRFEGDWLRIGTAALFGTSFLALGVIDLEHQLLPDKIVLPTLALGLVASPFLDHLDPWDGALGAAVGFLVFLPIWSWAMLTGREGRIMGFGDIKFTAMMGAALGLQFLGVALYAGVLLGGVVAACLLAARLLAPRALGGLRVMPYGTFLAMGGLIAVFYGRPIVDRVLQALT